ncbi:hypothetical protein BKA81DRAFT_404504 [Phyllosticta paracitricarpa]
MPVVGCTSPQKRHPTSPKKSSIGSGRDEESKLFQSLDQAQRSQSYRSRYDNSSYREQFDRENCLRSQSQPPSLGNHHHEGRESDNATHATNAVSDTPQTTITSFMAQIDERAQVKKSRRSSLGPAALKLVPEEDEEAVPTDRAFIESRREKQILEMMANSNTTPPRSRQFSVEYDDDTPPYAARVHQKKRSPKKGLRVAMPSHIRMRSKKFNLRFRSQSTSEAESPGNKALDDRRSKTLNPLPGTEGDMPSIPQAPSSSATQHTRFSDRSKSSKASFFQHNQGPSTLSLDSSSTPPPLPAKDTPPHLKKMNAELAARRMPGFESPGEHGMSETETGGVNADKKDPAEHEAAEDIQMRSGPAGLAQVVGRAPSIYSMRASIAGHQELLARDAKATPKGHGQQQTILRVKTSSGEVFDYSPSVYSVQSQTPGTCESDNFIRFPKHTSTLAPIDEPPDRHRRDQNTPVKAKLARKHPFTLQGTRTAPHIMENLHEDSSHDSSREQSEDIKTPVTETPGSSGDLNTPKQVPENAQSNRPPPPSFGLTPFLSQFQRDPNASPMNFQVQSAVPSPLNSRSNAQNMPSQNMPPQKMPPQNVPPPFITPRMPTNLDPFWEMLTGFDVINFHVNQAHSETRAATAQSQEEIFAYVGDQVDNIKSLMEEQCANHDRKMDAVERNVNCSADELEKVKKAIDTFNVNLDEQVMKPMKMLADKNNEVCSRLEKLDETMQRLERKLDDMVKTISSPPASQGGVIPNSCLPSLARPHDGPPVGYSRWHGYENLRQTAPGSQMPYTQVGQSYYNGGDSVQQPGNQNEHYNAGQGHGYDHAYSNSDRSRSGASTGNR